MKAIILARVSTEEQKEEGKSLPAQVARSREWCSGRKLDVVSEHQFDESSTKDHRKKFELVIKEIRSLRERVALVVETIDRLQRDFRESVMLLELVKAEKLEVHFIRENLVINAESNSSEFLRWDMGVMFARSYVLQLSDNIKRSNQQKLANGEWTGKAPLGYRNLRNEQGKSIIEIDDEAAPLIRRGFELYAAGEHSLLMVAAELHRLGLRGHHGGRVPLSRIYKNIQNPFYCGTMICKGKPYPHSYERVVSKELFDVCQERLKSYHKTRTKKDGRAFIFKGLVHCAHCGCRVTPEIKKGKYIYYSCTNGRKICKRRYIPEAVLLEPVLRLLRGLCVSEDRIKAASCAIRERGATHQSRRAATQESIRKGLARVSQKLDALLDLRLSGDVPQKDFEEKRVQLEAHRDELHRQEVEVGGSASRRDTSLAALLKLGHRMYDKFMSSEVAAKGRLLRCLLQNCTLDGDTPLYSLRVPFQAVHEIGQIPLGCGLEDVFRTIDWSGVDEQLKRLGTLLDDDMSLSS